MKLSELYNVSPQIHIFVHQHTSKAHSEELHEFTGNVFEAARRVLDIQIRNLPNYGASLIVEIER